MRTAEGIARYYADESRPDWVPDSAAFDEWLQATLQRAIEAGRAELPVEILHSRDPDSACTLTVFVDGAEVEDYTLEDIDPGSGWERSEWNERYDLPESYSPAFIAATLEALDAAGGSEYIEGGDDD